MNHYFENYEDIADSTYELDLEIHGSNRRKAPRTACMIPAHYNIDQRLYSGFILDISNSGACIETDRSFQAGTRLLLQYLDPFSRRSALVDGRIVWSSDSAVGVKFAIHPFTPI